MKQAVKFLVDFAFFLEESPKYKKIKGFFYDLLQNDEYKYKRYFDYFMIFLILSSVVIIIEEVEHPLFKWLVFYDIYVVTGIFVVEYILRLWVYNDSRKIVLQEFEQSIFLEKKFDLKKVLKQILKKKIEYIISPLAIVDLFAILPSYRELRILRIFVLFRVFKLLRYSRSITQFLQVISAKKVELFTLLFLVAFIVLISGISIYVFESMNNPDINSLFDAFYWALVTISTVGYGDIAPVSVEGRGITLIIILTGVGLISFATSIIVSAFNEKMHEIKEQRTLSSIDSINSYYLICGYSHLSELLAQRLKKEKRDFVVIDNDEQKILRASELGYLCIKGDAANQDTLLKLDIKKKVSAVICLAQSDMSNIFIALNIRSICKSIPIISRTIDKNSYKKLKLAGVDHIVSPYDLAGLMVSKFIEQPIAIEAIANILLERKNAVCDQVEVLKDSFLIDKTIKDINFKRYKLILLGVVRVSKEHFYFNPDIDFKLCQNDILIIMGYNISVSHFKSIVMESRLKSVRRKR